MSTQRHLQAGYGSVGNFRWKEKKKSVRPYVHLQRRSLWTSTTTAKQSPLAAIHLARMSSNRAPLSRFDRSVSICAFAPANPSTLIVDLGVLSGRSSPDDANNRTGSVLKEIEGKVAGRMGAPVGAASRRWARGKQRCCKVSIQDQKKVIVEKATSTPERTFALPLWQHLQLRKMNRT
uniref:Uncharacterized protein n=1 Tax=Trichuris muris TaxID=70415 RepID=A0A5S6QYY3_TRIMR